MCVCSREREKRGGAINSSIFHPEWAQDTGAHMGEEKGMERQHCRKKIEKFNKACSRDIIASCVQKTPEGGACVENAFILFLLADLPLFFYPPFVKKTHHFS